MQRPKRAGDWKHLLCVLTEDWTGTASDNDRQIGYRQYTVGYQKGTKVVVLNAYPSLGDRPASAFVRLTGSDRVRLHSVPLAILEPIRKAEFQTTRNHRYLSGE